MRYNKEHSFIYKHATTMQCNATMNMSNYLFIKINRPKLINSHFNQARYVLIKRNDITSKFSVVVTTQLQWQPNYDQVVS